MQVESMDYGIEDTSDIESILLETTWYAFVVPSTVSQLSRSSQVHDKRRTGQSGI
jgi:hypothetical protein